MKTILALLLVLVAQAEASTGDQRFIFCKVQSFDTKTANLVCDPKHPKETFVTPKEWIGNSRPLRYDAPIVLRFKEDRFKKWIAMNAPKTKIKKAATK